MEVEVELQGKSKVPSNSMVLPNRESVNDEAFDTSRLLEEVLERNNMLLNVKLFDGSFLTLFNAKDASSHHNI